MNTCETIRNGITDSLVEESELDHRVEEHIRTCDECALEYATSIQIWENLGEIDTTAEVTGFPSAWANVARRPAIAAAIAAVIFGLGIFVGIFANRPNNGPEADVAQLQQKVESLEELMALSLLEQSSASARLEAVSRISGMAEPSAAAVTGLLETAIADPNPNVRLAAIDAARPLLDRPGVYDELSERLEIETSPLVQIALVDLIMENPELARERVRTLLARDDVEEEVRNFVNQKMGSSI